ncbi:MAG: TIGR01777 family protein [Bdellovibrionales bacterium]|nr:TIGR01777 family protein [Bdellovibrionales bacterium]
MNIGVFGLSGFVGGHLKGGLEKAGHTVAGLSLRKTGWESKLENCEAVINLAGEPIFGKRWNVDVKAEIYNSRVHGTEKIVAAMGKIHAADSSKAKTFVCASAVGFYGANDFENLDETSSAGKDFLAFVCRDWEAAAETAQMRYKIRTSIVRTGIVLGPDGGALQTMMYPMGTELISPFKLGLGGPINSGKQWMSWIHVDDLCGIYQHAVENETVSGALNGTSPNPVRNLNFTKTLGAVLNRPTPFPIPGPALYLRFGESASILTTGQKVLPKATMQSGFQFKYDSLNDALVDCLK